MACPARSTDSADTSTPQPLAESFTPTLSTSPRGAFFCWPSSVESSISGIKHRNASRTAGRCNSPCKRSATARTKSASRPSSQTSPTAARTSPATSGPAGGQGHASSLGRTLPRSKRAASSSRAPLARSTLSSASAASASLAVQGSRSQKPYFRSVRENRAKSRSSMRRRCRNVGLVFASWKSSQAGRSSSKTRCSTCFTRVTAT